MREFFNVVPPDEALATLLDRLDVSVRGEVVQTAQALGRVTAEDVVSPEDMPPYPRSTMDGYSVRARDTFGASESLPAFCDVVGEVAMGSQPQVSLSTGQAASRTPAGCWPMARTRSSWWRTRSAPGTVPSRYSDRLRRERTSSRWGKTPGR